MFFHNPNFQRDRKSLLTRMRSVTALTRRKEEANATLRQEQALRAMIQINNNGGGSPVGSLTQDPFCIPDQQNINASTPTAAAMTGAASAFEPITLSAFQGELPLQQQQQQAINVDINTAVQPSVSNCNLVAASAFAPSCGIPQIQVGLTQQMPPSHQQQAASHNQAPSNNQPEQDFARTLLLNEIARLQAEQEQMAKRDNVRLALLQMRKLQQERSWGQMP